jgi:hypothetical protein
MTEKEIFIEKLKERTKKFSVDIILFCNSLKTSKASSVIAYQLIKSATSTEELIIRQCAEPGLNPSFLVKFVLL